MKHKALVWIGILAGVLCALVSVAVAAAATPIVGGTSFGTAVSISPGTEYSASLDSANHTSDYFTFNAAPGQIVTIVFTSTTTFNRAGFYLYDQSHISYLLYRSVNGTEQTFQFEYAGNNSTPTKYYFVVKDPGVGVNAYTFQYEVRAQGDGGNPGDAGDALGTAKVVTPDADTTYTDNQLGWADVNDWYKFNAAAGQIVTMTLTYSAFDGPSGSAPSLYYIVYDQSGTQTLGSGGLYTPGGAPKTIQWMSNNTLPSAYYLRVYVSSSNGLVHYAFRIQTDRQRDAGQPGDAGDASATAMVLAPGASTTYSGNLLGHTDTNDWYRVNAASGQIITASITYDAYDGTVGTEPTLYYTVLDQTGTHTLDSGSVTGPSAAPAVFRWMSNNTEPSAYFLRVYVSNSGGLVHYKFQIQTDRQSDAGQLGDAGDTLGTARVVTPNADTTYADNRLGWADVNDWYKFNAAAGQIVTMTLTYSAFDGPSGSAPSLYYIVYDQSGNQTLGSGGLYPPGSDPKTFQWMSNNTLPSAYYLRVYMSSSNNLVHYAFRIQTDRQRDAGQLGDAGDASTTAMVLAPGASTTYSGNLLGHTDTDDWYRVNVASGQIITASITYDAYDGTVGTEPALSYTVLDQTGTHTLDSGFLGGPSGVPAVFRWISNNTEPSAYYFHLSIGGNRDLLHYSLQIQLQQQNDAAQPGDAGDDFDAARVVTLSSQSRVLQATRNLFGGSDSVDYYLIKLPPVPPFESPVRYGFWIAPVNWPAESGFLTVTIYDAQRNQIPGMSNTFNAPSKNRWAKDITGCGSNGCYIKVTTGFSGYYRFQYSIDVEPLRSSYLPLIMR